MKFYHKGREAPVDYTIDWGPGWLRGAVIAASRWIVDGGADGAILVRDRPAGDGITSATLSGGMPGERYTVRNEVLLSDGRTAARSLTLAIGGGR